MKQLLNTFKSWKKSIKAIVHSLVMVILAITLLATPALATGVYEISGLTPDTWVVDEADVISRANEGKISSALSELAQASGNEVRFITVRRLDYGETPESFTKALFEKWFPSKEAQVNQTLIMIDTLTNGNAIITGDAVKATLADDTAKSITDETLMAPLRDGNRYNQAFLDVSDRVVAILSGKPDPGPPEIVDNVRVESTFASSEETEKERGNSTAWVIGLLIAATVIPMATYYIYQVNQPSSDG
ncbi:photosystem II repair protein Psb32 [Calothrix sp. PCC 6303]|uniref:photosystem II repair protein Psb32 n=1 Tax=Calothrix sp. PCC 6303 TaxID=1170562 RepID=UPI0002A04AE7|nr:TPM domain-containing protein [Calothrix sp. PCC 6303]AFZ04348.1 protein of unknown function DUF477 [Calothrix sp. PCC 6303]